MVQYQIKDKRLKITTVRRISQIFFLVLFLWLCVVMTVGTEWFRLRGWPVNWFLQLDPLVAIGTALSTGTIYRGLIWALPVIILTIIFGRFFCGWLCPFGTMHQFFGWLGSRNKSMKEKILRNRYRKSQRLKYLFLVVFLLMAALPWAFARSLQTGLLDPIPFVYRSINEAVLPVLDRPFNIIDVSPRHYEWGWLIGGLFITMLLLNLVIPRFYCRFICPLGALLGILSRYSIFRIGKTKKECIDCGLCNQACEGACNPAGKIRIPECVLCMNCLHVCPETIITYDTSISAAGEYREPDPSRREFIGAAVIGILAVPLLRIGGKVGENWYHKVIRPPGSLNEEEFLKRCIKCGQCMRVCPTNIIVPGGPEGGIESIMTPVLNFRSGTSGCQLNCTACGYICPTSAIRPISLSEKLGLNEFADQGPIKLGTAFVDRGRCLPWAMKKPCIVCQENCPVTPKAIYIDEIYETVRDGKFDVLRAEDNVVYLQGATMQPGQYATGDYFLESGDQKRRITDNAFDMVQLDITEFGPMDLKKGGAARITVLLQRPRIDIKRCIGCGTCEHECPVSGKRAIRVSAENETRSQERSLLLRGQ